MTSPDDLDVAEEPSFTLKQEPSEGEQERLKAKLKQLTIQFREREIPPKNMLHFVIMAENFNINSNFNLFFNCKLTFQLNLKRQLSAPTST